MYPTLNLLDEDARAVARDRKAEEDQAKKALAHLEGLDASSSAFADVFEQFRLDVDRHAQQEETLVLPLLEQADDDERRSMGHAFAAAEALAPTHAHRMAPESAVGNLLVGPFVAMVDKVRDAVRDARRGGST